PLGCSAQKHQVYFCLLISGGLASSSPISGIPDSFSCAHHLTFLLSFSRRLAASLGTVELLCL
uniref:Uncharacterized protein n=1 Tax=Equus asinus asinus TaxID=83772 RepID=A0A8C4L5Z3_EQUAS